MNSSEKTPFWRNVAVLRWAFQLAIVAVVGVIIAILVNNLLVNSSSQGIPLGFGFLSQPASFPITANDFRDTQPVWQAMYEGVLNTLRVVLVGFVLATVFGVLIGLGRLSGNWLIRTISTVYIEIIRNVPLLLIVIFAYLGLVLEVFPRIEDSWDLAGTIIVNGRGFSIPWITGPFVGLLAAVVLSIAAGLAVRRWRLRVAESKDESAYVVPWMAAAMVAVLFWVGFFAGLGFSSPSVDGRNVVGGMTMQPEYFALLFALVTYTASHIAEIVRGSVQSVAKGQVEASQAMALNGWQRMRYVIFPQALRVAIPPLGNQYLNLMKNSSLGFAVSYFELTKVVTTSVGTRSPAVPAFLVLMIIYLIMSLTISALVNIANRKMEVVGR